MPRAAHHCVDARGSVNGVTFYVHRCSACMYVCIRLSGSLMLRNEPWTSVRAPSALTQGLSHLSSPNYILVDGRGPSLPAPLWEPFCRAQVEKGCRGL